MNIKPKEVVTVCLKLLNWFHSWFETYSDHDGSVMILTFISVCMILGFNSLERSQHF